MPKAPSLTLGDCPIKRVGKINFVSALGTRELGVIDRENEKKYLNGMRKTRRYGQT